MKNQEIREKLSVYFDVISIRNGVWTAKRSYFYRQGSPEVLAKSIQSLLPNSNIIECGDHWRPFKGSAKTGGPQDSYMFVKFTI